MTFKCIDSCGECCGLVGIPKETVKEFEHLKQREVTEIHLWEGEIYTLTIDGFCVFLSDKNECVIYNDRPDICRNFGISKDFRLQCPYLKQNGNKRSEAKVKRFQRMMNKYMKESMKLIETKLKRRGKL